MSKQYKLPAQFRTDEGKGASRRLRRSGLVPAVVYGGDRDPVNISIEHDVFLHQAAEQAFHSSILELKVDDKKQKVVLRDLQRHPWQTRIMHADFMRISDDQEIRMDVPLHFVNEDKAPASREVGVVISHQIVEVEIESLPANLPEYIEVDLSSLEAGESIMLSDLDLPEGVILPALHYEGEEHDQAVVSAIYIRATQGTGELAAEADEALEEGAEVETIGEEDKADDGEGEADSGDAED